MPWANDDERLAYYHRRVDDAKGIAAILSDNDIVTEHVAVLGADESNNNVTTVFIHLQEQMDISYVLLCKVAEILGTNEIDFTAYEPGGWLSELTYDDPTPAMLTVRNCPLVTLP